MAYCHACERETASYGELLPSGMVNRCGHEDCRQPIDGSRLPSAKSQIPEVPRLAAELHEEPFGQLANARPGMVLPGRPHVAAAPLGPPVRVPAPVPLAPPAPQVPSAPPAAPAPPRPLDEQIVELRARRAEVKRQLAGVAALQREEASLERMLAAFDAPAT